MPYSFTKIEEEKSKTISFVFGFLVVFYFFSAWFIYFAVKNFFHFQYVSRYAARTASVGLVDLSLKETLIVLGVASVVAAGHWANTVYHLIQRFMGTLHAEYANPDDSYHKMFQNIVDEVSVATGGQKIRAVVMPTLAMNAFALADFNGNAVIGVTEGLLCRLNRAQIEAVVGHEAAHIVSGDCLVTTVTSSLFNIYNDVLKTFQRTLSSGSRYRYSSRSGGGMALILFVYLLLFITTNMGKAMRMFLSRQKEYRADAVAVRLTRDPLSLAEALYTISTRWRGAGIPGETLDAIFIVNPHFHERDERDGLFPDLFSTHPPTQKRLDILLNMAHSNVKVLEDEFQKDLNHPKKMAPEFQKTQSPLGLEASQWLIHHEGKWEGPFGIAQMATFQWLHPGAWVKRMGDEHIKRAYEDEQINELLTKAKATETTLQCPRCNGGFAKESYEGVSILRCVSCHGVWAKEQDVQKILIRRDYDFSPRIKEICAHLKKKLIKPQDSRLNLKSQPLLSCPNCRHREAKMVRSFFSGAYPVEIDRCVFCGYIWFDNDELEILQCLVEGNLNQDGEI